MRKRVLQSLQTISLRLREQREHRLPVLGLCLRPHWISPSPLFSISLPFLRVRIALKLRSLRFHCPRLCRIAVFLIHTIVSLRCGEAIAVMFADLRRFRQLLFYPGTFALTCTTLGP